MRGIPECELAGRQSKGHTHTHTQTGMNVCKQDTHSSHGGSPLKLIAQTVSIHCVQVCVEKKVSQWGEEERRVERFLNEAA